MYVTAVPGSPANLKLASVSPNSVTLSWEPPTSDGGADIKQYIIVQREASKKKFKKCGKTKDTTFITSSNLEEGLEYFFRVYAENAVGISQECAELEDGVKIGSPDIKADDIVEVNKEVTEEVQKDTAEVKEIVPEAQPEVSSQEVEPADSKPIQEVPVVEKIQKEVEVPSQKEAPTESEPVQEVPTVEQSQKEDQKAPQEEAPAPVDELQKEEADKVAESVPVEDKVAVEEVKQEEKAPVKDVSLVIN